MKTNNKINNNNAPMYNNRYTYIISCDSKYNKGERIYLKSPQKNDKREWTSDIQKARRFVRYESAEDKLKRLTCGNPRIERYALAIDPESVVAYDNIYLKNQ